MIMLPVQIGIGEAIDIPVNLDTSSLDPDYALSAVGIEGRVTANGENRVLFTAAVSIDDAVSGELTVSFLPEETILLRPGLWSLHIVDSAGPLRLTTIALTVDYLPGAIPEITTRIYGCKEDGTGETVKLIRGEDYTEENALFFQTKRTIDPDATLYAVMGGERYPASGLLDDNDAVIHDATAVLELTYDDTAELAFAADRFQIIEVLNPAVGDADEDSPVNVLYDGIVTVTEG